MSEHGHRLTFWAYWRKNAWALAGVTALVLLLEARSCLGPVESFGIDRFVRVYKAPISRQIFLVEITDADYKRWFGNKSPLDGAVVQRLLMRIAADAPTVIGVDLDTTDTPLPELANDRRFVWAEVPESMETSGAEDVPDPRFALAPVVGGLLDPSRMGMPQFPQDEDGLVRRFADSYYVLQDHMRVSIKSMGCAVMSAYYSYVKCDPPGRERRFSVSGDRFRFQTVDASAILSRPDDAPLPDSPFKGKIVFVGGRYRAGRDSYITPAGELAGVEVIANAAQSYVRGEGRAITEAPLTASGVFDLLIGTLIIGIYFRLRERRLLAFAASLTLGPVLAMSLSFLAFLWLHYWLGFMPVILGLVLHELLRYGEDLHEAEAEAGPHAEPRSSLAERFSGRFPRRPRYPRRDRS